jgi:hypothetical protein
MVCLDYPRPGVSALSGNSTLHAPGLRELASKADLDALRAELVSKAELEAVRSELKSDMRSLRVDVASDLLATRKELSDQIVGLRRAVIDYHTSVIGHGMLISDLEARMRRVEQTPEASLR